MVISTYPAVVPAKAGTQRRQSVQAIKTMERHWVPAYAGMTNGLSTYPAVIPAKAGTQRRQSVQATEAIQRHRVPAYAGMTDFPWFAKDESTLDTNRRDLRANSKHHPSRASPDPGLYNRGLCG